MGDPATLAIPRSVGRSDKANVVTRLAIMPWQLCTDHRRSDHGPTSGTPQVKDEVEAHL